MIKTQILTSREVLYTKLVRVISPFLPKKKCFPKYGFFSLKMSVQVKKKNLQSMFLKIIQVSADEEMGK